MVYVFILWEMSVVIAMKVVNANKTKIVALESAVKFVFLFQLVLQRKIPKDIKNK